jgi:Mg2+/Co2+ transporter CorC
MALVHCLSLSPRNWATAPMVGPETVRIARQFQPIHAQYTHLASVIDEYDALVDIVMLEDLIGEIVADINEAFAHHSLPYPVEATEKAWVAHGLATCRT